MPNERFERKTEIFASKGMNLSLPVNLLAQNLKYRVLKNVRLYGGGEIAGRAGTVQASTNTLDGVAHSIKRVHDPNPGGGFLSDIYIAGDDQGKLYTAEAGDGFTFGPSLTADLDGFPLSFVTFKPDFNDRPWTVIGNSDKNYKISTGSALLQYGIAPPNFAPRAALGAANPDGPDVGATGVNYIYRLVARADPQAFTGAQSNPGPPLRDSLSINATGNEIKIWIDQTHPDPQVGWLDVYRYGGTLPEWIYVGSFGNVAATEASPNLVDYFGDDVIASNKRLEEDNNQPFLIVAPSAQGTCTVTPNGGTAGDGCTITRTGGDSFSPYSATSSPYWVAGNEITVNGQVFHMYRSPDSTDSVEVVEDLPEAISGDFLVLAPEQAHFPLQHLWGPFGTGEVGTFIFAVGDPNRPGAVYWTKGNSPESHPGTNVLDVTNPSERMQNGCMFDGRSWCWSTERMFALYPTFGQVSDFAAIEIPNSKGLAARWGFCVGPRIWFLGRDGIYETTGGEPVDITSEDLYPLFRRMSDSEFVLPDGFPDNFPVTIDFNQEDRIRMSYVDGFVLFTFNGSDAAQHTLVYDTKLKAWTIDEYDWQLIHVYSEEGPDAVEGRDVVHQALLCGENGAIYRWGAFYSDNGAAIDGQIRSGAVSHGGYRQRNFYGDAFLDFDSDCEVIDAKLGFDDFTFFSSIELSGLNRHGRRRAVGDINSGLGQYAWNIGIDITWSVTVGIPRFYAWEPSYIVKPELTVLRITDPSDCGYPGPKFIQGFRLVADTLGIDRTVEILDDAGVAHGFITPGSVLNTVNHLGERKKPYVFSTPFISHFVRVHPTDIDFWRVFEIEWIFEPAPDLVSVWTTQETTLDFPGYFHHRDSFIALVSTTDVNYRVAAGGTNYDYTIPAQGGYGRPYTTLQPMKAKFVTYSLTDTGTAGFRLFVRDCSVRVRGWGFPGPYVVKQPFGDVSRAVGARI